MLKSNPQLRKGPDFQKIKRKIGERYKIYGLSWSYYDWFQFDQTEIDEALEDKRRNEVLHGASDLTEVKDEDLFVIDRGNKKKEPKKGKTNNEMQN